jgi:hypothetical protein
VRNFISTLLTTQPFQNNGNTLTEGVQMIKIPNQWLSHSVWMPDAQIPMQKHEKYEKRR